MKIKKKIKINSCFNCPFCEETKELNKKKFICNLYKKEIIQKEEYDKLNKEQINSFKVCSIESITIN